MGQITTNTVETYDKNSKTVHKMCNFNWLKRTMLSPNTNLTPLKYRLNTTLDTSKNIFK